MGRRSFDLVVVVAITVLSVVLTLLRVSNVAIRTIFALPFALVLPGYALTAAMLSKCTLGGPERVAFSLGLSLAVAVLGGLALNWMPWGLRADSWVVLLGSVTLGASLVALLRRRDYLTVDPGRWNAGLHVHQVLLFGLAALVVVGAMVVARIGALRQHTPAFTQLWILSADETDQGAVRVGVRSMESPAKRYRLQVDVSGRVAREWPLIELEPGQTWETTVVLPTEHSEAETVEAVLYRLNAPEEAYRRVVLWRKK